MHRLTNYLHLSFAPALNEVVPHSRWLGFHIWWIDRIHDPCGHSDIVVHFVRFFCGGASGCRIKGYWWDVFILEFHILIINMAWDYRLIAANRVSQMLRPESQWYDTCSFKWGKPFWSLVLVFAVSTVRCFFINRMGWLWLPSCVEEREAWSSFGWAPPISSMTCANEARWGRRCGAIRVTSSWCLFVTFRQMDGICTLEAPLYLCTCVTILSIIHHQSMLLSTRNYKVSRQLGVSTDPLFGSHPDYACPFKFWTDMFIPCFISQIAFCGMSWHCHDRCLLFNYYNFQAYYYIYKYEVDQFSSIM